MKFQIVKDVLNRSVGKSADREKQIGIINNLELNNSKFIRFPNSRESTKIN